MKNQNNYKSWIFNISIICLFLCLGMIFLMAVSDNNLLPETQSRIIVSFLIFALFFLVFAVMYMPENKNKYKLSNNYNPYTDPNVRCPECGSVHYDGYECLDCGLNC